MSAVKIGTSIIYQDIVAPWYFGSETICPMSEKKKKKRADNEMLIGLPETQCHQLSTCSLPDTSCITSFTKPIGRRDACHCHIHDETEILGGQVTFQRTRN